MISNYRRALLQAVDLLCILIALLACELLTIAPDLNILKDYTGACLFTIFFYLLFFYILDAYNVGNEDFKETIGRVSVACVLGIISSATASYAFQHWRFDRTTTSLLFLLSLLLCLAWRYIYNRNTDELTHPLRILLVGVDRAGKVRQLLNEGLPKARIIDMRTPGFATGKEGRRKISPPLEEAMGKVLSEGKQALLLLNRRGYWVGVECPSCGYFFSCPQCGSSLAYHREDNLLKCHHCGHVELYPERCPQCGRKGFRRVGYGTERLEEECLRLFPDARTGRLDSDVTVSRERMEKVLQDFREHRLDILVGTQMIAKGHDFPEVALSALVDADIGLQVPGYRSAERVFNLVCQTIGRAGRALAPGSAYVQTFNPSSSAIRFGALQDYEGFYEAEMRRRKEAGEPPYRYLLLLTYLSDKEGKALEAAIRTKERLQKLGFPRFRALGPIDPYYQDHGRERKGLLLSFFEPEPVKKAVKEIADSFLPLGVGAGAREEGGQGDRRLLPSPRRRLRRGRRPPRLVALSRPLARDA